MINLIILLHNSNIKVLSPSTNRVIFKFQLVILRLHKELKLKIKSLFTFFINPVQTIPRLSKVLH